MLQQERHVPVGSPSSSVGDVARETETLELDNVDDLDDVLLALCRVAVETLKVTHSELVVFDSNAEEGRIAAEYPPHGTWGHLFPIKRLPVANYLTSKEPLYLSDLTKGSSLIPVSDALISYGIRSVLLFPIITPNGLNGCLCLYLTEPRIFALEEIALGKSFAEQAGITLRNATLLRRYERENAQLSNRLNNVTNAAKTVGLMMILNDLKKTLAEVVERTRDVIGCDAVTLFVYSELTDQLDEHTSVSGVWNQERATRCGRASRDSVVYKMLWQDDLCVVPSVADHELFKSTRFANEEKIKSLVAVPLKFLGHRVGVMFVNYRSPHDFAPEELRNIEQLFASQAAVAIRNALLHEELKNHVSSLNVLHHASEEITKLSIGKRSKVLDKIAEQAVRCFEQATLATIQTYDKATDELVCESASRKEKLVELPLKGKRTVLHGNRSGKIGIGGRAVKDQNALLVPNVANHSDYVEFEPTTRSQMAVPFSKSGDSNNILGVINIESDKLAAFHFRDRQLLEAFAELAAITIQNAERYAEITIQNAEGYERLEAETTLARAGMESSVWGHNVAGQAGNIRDTIAFLRERLSAHDSDSGLKDSIEEKLSVIDNIALEILEKPLSSPLSYEDGISNISINDLISERVKQLWRYEPYSPVRVKTQFTEESTVVRGNPFWLKRALDVLLDNAIQAMDKNAERQLTIATKLTAAPEGSNAGVEITLADTGTGIPPDILPRLFYRRIEKLNGKRGWGVGLLIAQAIIQTYGGLIRVASTGSEGTVMAVWLPPLHRKGDGPVSPDSPGTPKDSDHK